VFRYGHGKGFSSGLRRCRRRNGYDAPPRPDHTDSLQFLRLAARCSYLSLVTGFDDSRLIATHAPTLWGCAKIAWPPAPVVRAQRCWGDLAQPGGVSRGESRPLRAEVRGAGHHAAAHFALLQITTSSCPTKMPSAPFVAM
jgi:hypothetical protein